MTRTQFSSGIVGAGMIGKIHAYAVRASGGHLAMVADTFGDNAQAAAAQLGADRSSREPLELINDPGIDVVHICTPNATHAELTMAALDAGKAVICEKPLATTVADALALQRKADHLGAVTAVPFVYRFHANVREARARIARGDAGRLWMLHGSYLQDWLSRASDTNWRVDPQVGGASRAFADIGVHWCDLMEFVTGHRIVKLSAHMANAFQERQGTEDGCVVLFETDQGATGSVVTSQVSPGRKNRLAFSFDGTEASYAFDQENPEQLWVGGRDQNVLVMRDPSTSQPSASTYSHSPAGHPQGYREAFTFLINDVYRKLGGEDVDGLPTFDDGLRAAQLTDAVIASSHSRSWESVQSDHLNNK